MKTAFKNSLFISAITICLSSCHQTASAQERLFAPTLRPAPVTYPEGAQTPVRKSSLAMDAYPGQVRYEHPRLSVEKTRRSVRLAVRTTEAAETVRPVITAKAPYYPQLRHCRVLDASVHTGRVLR